MSSAVTGRVTWIPELRLIVLVSQSGVSYGFKGWMLSTSDVFPKAVEFVWKAPLL